MSLLKTNKQAHTRRWLLLCATLWLTGAGDAWAGTGTLIVMPQPRTRPTSRLQMFIDTSWVDSQGFRPVKVTFRPIGKLVFPADRNLVVELRPGRWGTLLDTRLEASRNIELPEGAESASTTLYLPQDGPYGIFAVRVYEDGNYLSDLSNKQGFRNTTMRWTTDESPAIIFLTAEVPSVYDRRTVTGMRAFSQLQDLTSAESMARLSRMITSPNYGNANLPLETWLAYQWPQVSAAAPSFEFMNPADLPELLPGLSSVDLILIQRHDLAQLALESPASLDLLRRWMLAGGNLCTTGGGEDFEAIHEIESLFDLAPAELTPKRKKSGLPLGQLGPLFGSVWRYPDDWEYGSLVVEFRNLQRRAGQVEESTDIDPPARAPFVLRPAQFGQLILTSADDFELDKQDWNWLIKSIPGRMWKWSIRQGLALNSANDGFWDFTVPGVGLPPVTAFQVLITIFALIIGPLNYLVLSRRRKLSWLMATVPLGSLVTIVGLIGFAMFTDGISVRARVRSLTHIDQRTQHAVSYSRQSYYAGVAPADGLVYPDETVVLPIDHTPISGNGMMARKRRVVEHRGDVVHYKVGYLPSRTTVQYMVTQSQKTKLRIDFEVDDAQPVATNGLGTKIEALFYLDGDGKTHFAQNIEVGAISRLAEITEKDARDRLSEIMGRDQLEPPLGIDRSLLRDGLVGESWDMYGRQRSRHSNRSSPMERSFGSLRDFNLSKMNRNSYLAVVESCSEVPLGIDSCDIRAAFHVVAGQL